MAAISNYLANNILDWLHGGTAFTLPTTTYFALMTSMPTGSGGGVEVSGGSYARVAVVNNSSNWPASVSQIKTNAVAIDWGTATANWGTIVGYAEYDASSGGNLLTFAFFASPVTITSGNPFSVPIGSGIFTGWLPNLSNYLDDKLNDWIHGGTAFTQPATTYFALMSTLPTAANSGGVELSGTGYARVAFTNSSGNWPAASAQTKSNAAAINWGTAGAGGWGTAVGVAEYDASSGGNLLSFGDLTSATTINASQPFEIPVNGAVYTAQ